MSRPVRPARLGLAAALLLVGAVGAACSGDDPPAPDPSASESTGPRPLTADEADLLAGVRANNYRREVVPFEIEVPVDDSVATLVGRADMRQHLAVAGGTSTSASGPPSYATFAWNLGQMAIVDTQAAPTPEQLAQAAEVPTTRWQVHDLAGSTQPLDQVARVLLNLALDRTDNAQLLRQNGAEFRGTTTVDGKDVVLMTASSGGAQTLTYYVDPETALMVRVDVALGGDRPATITFLDGDKASIGAVPVIKALGSAPSTQPSTDTPS